jgi:hypothetical protein
MLPAGPRGDVVVDSGARRASDRCPAGGRWGTPLSVAGPDGPSAAGRPSTGPAHCSGESAKRGSGQAVTGSPEVA